MKHLLLFDIDGTLLRCGPQVRPLFVGALEQVYGGYEIPEGFAFAGKTDPMIVAEMVASTGLGPDEIRQRLPAMSEVYIENLKGGLKREGMRILPGVRELLDRLRSRDDVLLGLLTGNWRGGAREKLERFDLWQYFEVGAFGDDAADRRGLVPVALERAQHLAGRPFAVEHAMIIGDTILDVDCAQAAGVPCVAVATGFTEIEELRQAGADWAFADLIEAGRELTMLAP